MAKRIWKASPVFTFLFLLSFTLTFGIAYYGMSLKGQLQTVGQTAIEMDYGYRGSFYVDNSTGGAGIALPELDTGIICYMVGMGCEDIVVKRSIYVIMEMNEPMLEPLAEGDGFAMEKNYGSPQCVCSMAWKKYVREDGDKKILSLNGRDCEVAGILEPNDYANSDWRLFLYGPSLPEEFMEGLFGTHCTFLVDYRSAAGNSADIEKFNNWVLENFQGTEVCPGMEEVDGSMDSDFKYSMSIYRVFFMFLMVFCFFDCAFLTYVWCTQKLRENMIKRVFGFSMVKIWLEGILELVSYEVVSLLLAGIFCLVFEAARGKIAAFFLTWKEGAGLMGTVVLLFTIPLSLINILYLQKIKPADTLKAAE